MPAERRNHISNFFLLNFCLFVRFGRAGLIARPFFEYAECVCHVRVADSRLRRTYATMTASSPNYCSCQLKDGPEHDPNSHHFYYYLCACLRLRSLPDVGSACRWPDTTAPERARFATKSSVHGTEARCCGVDHPRSLPWRRSEISFLRNQHHQRAV